MGGLGLAKKIKERPYAGGRWTSSQFWSFIRSGLRQKSNRWPVKYDVLNNCKRQYKGPNKRQKFEWQCNVCKEWVGGKEINVDHIEPVGSLRSFSDLPAFVRILFCESENLQAICSDCHSKKTKKESDVRRKSLSKV